jgi:tmRNA-binding protein
MFTKIPFQIDYPLEIFNPIKEVDFMDKEERRNLFERNIYYNLFGKERNNLLEKKHKLFFELGNQVLDYVNQTHPNLEVQNLSLFGSSTVLDNPGDYDFLAITSGDIFDLEEPILELNGNEIQTGISIKGIDNYLYGFKKKDESIQSNRLEQIIDRTSISLFRRHIPLFGKDFVNNEEEFLKNAFAQVSDLVNNAYELFYLKQNNYFIPDEKRAKKLLTRIYEATSYFGAVDSDERIQKMREDIYLALKDKFELEKSKKLFDKFGELYEEKVKQTKNI